MSVLGTGNNEERERIVVRLLLLVSLCGGRMWGMAETNFIYPMLAARAIPPDRSIALCKLCDKPGHFYEKCPMSICAMCGRRGHIVRKCPDRPEQRAGAPVAAVAQFSGFTR